MFVRLSSIKMISLNAVRRLVPNDNNCLFAAFVYLCGGKHPDESEQQQVSMFYEMPAVFSFLAYRVLQQSKLKIASKWIS